MLHNRDNIYQCLLKVQALVHHNLQLLQPLHNKVGKLLKQLPAQVPADPLLVEEIELRAKSCRLITNAPAADAPSLAGSGG